MNTFFTSDQHYGHTNIIKYSRRPFRDADHMNEELVRRHNERVTERDTVFHLGDFAMRERLVPSILRRLNGIHHLVVGNHDACHRSHSGGEDGIARYRNYGFVDVVESMTLEIAGRSVFLHHLPFRDHAGQETYRDGLAAFRPKDDGRPLLHGHVHTQWRVQGRMINVGVDQWDYAPVSLEEIVGLLAREGAAV